MEVAIARGGLHDVIRRIVGSGSRHRFEFARRRIPDELLLVIVGPTVCHVFGHCGILAGWWWASLPTGAIHGVVRSAFARNASLFLAREQLNSTGG